MRLLFVLLLISFEAGAVEYVRAASSCTFNGDGTQPTCATSNLGPGARRAFSTAVTAAEAGEEVCILEDITQTTRFIITSAGTAGSPVKITGDCNGATSKPELKATDAGVVIEGLDDSNVWLDYLKVTGSNATQTQAIKFTASTANRSGIKLTRIEASNAFATSATPNHAIWITASGGYTWSDVVIDDVDVHSAGAANTQNSDGLNIEYVASGLSVSNVRAWGNYSEGLDISSGGTGPVIRNIRAWGNGAIGIKAHCGTGAVSGALMHSVLSYDNGAWALALQDWSSSVFANMVARQPASAADVRPSQSPFGALQIENANPGTCTQTGNTYANLDLSADYANGVVRLYTGTKADFESGNTWNGNNLRQLGAQTPLLYWNNDTGNNVTAANHATWVSSHPKDIIADPAFIGGTSPTTPDGFLPTNTALFRTGTRVGDYADFKGCRFSIPPSIGAYEMACGGTVNRTAR